MQKRKVVADDPRVTKDLIKHITSLIRQKYDLIRRISTSDTTTDFCFSCGRRGQRFRVYVNFYTHRYREVYPSGRIRYFPWTLD